MINLFAKKILLMPIPYALGLYLIRYFKKGYREMVSVNLTLESVQDQMRRGFDRYSCDFLNADKEPESKELIENKNGQIITLDGQKCPFGFEGWDGFSLGNACLIIEKGSFFIQRDGSWSFSGLVRMNEEIFDFNPGIDPLTGKKYRTIFKELLVKFGAFLPGRDFRIHFLNNRGEDAPLEVHLTSR